MSSAFRVALAAILKEQTRQIAEETAITGVEGIRVELARLGYSVSYITVRRMLARGEIPATRESGVWRTTKALLEGRADTLKRAAGEHVCLCRWCPEHGRGSKKRSQLMQNERK